MPELGENVIVAGRFRLNRKLGQGGMGSVWHATQLGLDTACALKFIEGDFAMVPEMQQRFEREAKAAAALRSPHVVAIIDHAIWDGIPFIAMELLDGEDLRHRLERVGRLSPDDTVLILGQVCRALTKAHSLGIVHRDMKPDNIYLVRDDDREIAKVLDFGIAKSTSGLEGGGNTKTGAMLGTPYYMSPEQAQGTKTLDFRSDLWSMAVIAFQCVTGRLPFESEALGDLLMRIMVTPLPIPSQVASVPLGFDAWWIRAASRDPAGRFDSAKEFVDSLSRALSVAGGMSHGTLGGAAHDAGGDFRATAPIALANPVSPGGIGAITPNPGAPPMARTFNEEPPQPPRASLMPVLAGVILALLLAGGGAAYFFTRAKPATGDVSVAPPPSALVEAGVEAPPTSQTANVPPPPSAIASAPSAQATSTAKPQATSTAKPQATSTAKPQATSTATPQPTSKPKPPATSTPKPPQDQGF